MKPEVKVNRKFLVFFITFQIIMVGLVLFAFLAPKTVTVRVENQKAYVTEKPLEIKPAFVDLKSR